jgi:Icc-related predicted phosphoesterase
MLVHAISDLHGYKPPLDGGDLLIIAGDLTARDTLKEYEEFTTWLLKLPYRHKVVIGGNHDTLLEEGSFVIEGEGIHYLCDSGVEIEGIKLWGSPYTARFTGQNPDCMAFSVKSDFQLRDHFDLIPEGLDILITHSPPYWILDSCPNGRVGSKELYQAISRVRPKVCLFGHIHECGGKTVEAQGTTFANCSYVDAFYRPMHLPVTIDL